MRFETKGQWEEWLAVHHDDSSGLWLQLARKGSGGRSLSYDEALTIALCFGWIDGQKGSLDHDYWLQRFAPRRPASKWSKVNVERAEALIQAGRMRPAGLREVERAKADGRWEQAYEPPSRMAIPDDFARALADNERASAFFAALDSANRYAVLYRIATARRPETRAGRIASFVEMLTDHRKIHP